MNTNWCCKNYKDLSLDEFHDIIQLRELVFVVEQDCPYLDVDGKDKDAIHVIGVISGKIVATARILPPGISYDEVSIGRVVVHPDFRGCKLGNSLMEKAMSFIKNYFGNVPIRISAQTYLEKFYTDLEFQIVGEPYLEDNIPHIQMLYRP